MQEESEEELYVRARERKMKKKVVTVISRNWEEEEEEEAEKGKKKQKKRETSVSETTSTAIERQKIDLLNYYIFTFKHIYRDNNIFTGAFSKKCYWILFLVCVLTFGSYVYFVRPETGFSCCLCGTQ